DGDPLDVLVLCSEALLPMTLVRCYPIGVIRMIDSGRHDDKIIAIPFDDPNYNTYQSIDELPPHIFAEMTHFFRVYKELENKTTAVNEVEDKSTAKQIIEEDIDRYIEKFCK
ncbi:MAG: inorganic diphosphatase, partial [Oscillospiraceae bacterium]|nr:inorganic diphosphatase [Oscillospiraceae bacterium]